MNEESSFWCLISIFKKPIYKTFCEFEPHPWDCEFHVILELCKIYVPKIIEKDEIVCMYSWLISSFLHYFQPEVSCRIFDVICVEGFNAVHRVFISFLLIFHDDIVSDRYTYSQQIPKNFYNADELMKKVYSLKLKDSKIEELRSNFKKK
jgi:hypothetical protein